MTPLWGALGAVVALVISRFIEGAYLATRAARAYDMTVRNLVPWGDLARVLIAAIAAAGVLYIQPWTDRMGLIGVVAGSLAFLVLFALLLAALRVREMSLVLRRLRDVAPRRQIPPKNA